MLEIFKESDFSFHFLTNCNNGTILKKKFPDSSKLFSIVHVPKKKDPNDKKRI